MVGEVEAEGAIGQLLVDIGSVALWLQAVGVVILLWIIFESFILFLNYRRMKEVYKIKEDMRRFLGEEPAISIDYIKDAMINEDGSGSKEIEVVSKVTIVFTDLDDRIKKIEFLA